MKIEETCTCGGKLAIDHTEEKCAMLAMQTWRAGHKCRPPGAGNGSSSSFGFSHEVRRPFDAGDGQPFHHI